MSSHYKKNSSHRSYHELKRRQNGRHNSSSSSSSTSDVEERESKLANVLEAEEVLKELSEDILNLMAGEDSLPTFECFASEIRSSMAMTKLFEDLREGDVICARVRRVELAGLYLQPLCVLHPFRRYLKWINDFKVVVERDMQNVRDYRPNDIVKVIYKGNVTDSSSPMMILDEEAGLLAEADLPSYFRKCESFGASSFEDCLKDHQPMSNPNLANHLGIKMDSTFSFLKELQGKDFSPEKRAPYMRRKQNQQLSMESVKCGVERIREGQNMVAVQHFNKALNIDDRNVEALVGRAAAYANMGQYHLAETDLDTALLIKEKHINARAYMVETLLQRAKKFEEENKKEEAKAKYEKILKIKNDDRARKGLRRLERSPSIEVIEKSTDEEKRKDDERKRRKALEIDRRKRKADAEKLAEFEEFIAKLKSK